MHAADLIEVQPDMLAMYFDVDLPSYLSFKNCPSTINLFKIKNGVAVHDHTCPGLSNNAKLDMAIVDNRCFWIPQGVKKMVQCSKFPGKCAMTFKDSFNLHRHEEICKIETIITTKMVT